MPMMKSNNGVSPAIQNHWTAKQFFDQGFEVASGKQALIDNGMVALPGLAFRAAPSTGIHRASTNMGFAIGGVNVMTLNTAASTVVGNLNVTGNILWNTRALGAAYTIPSSGGPSLFWIDIPSPVVTLPRATWVNISGTATTVTMPMYFVVDVLRQVGPGNPFTLMPYDDGFGGASEWNDINGLYGIALATPSFQSTTTGGIWQIVRNPLDTGTGAIGGWTCVEIGVIA